jgi:high-affinity K+ transport system ATPase subunit B
VIFNALIIVADPAGAEGREATAPSAAALLRRNLLIYGWAA